MKVILCLFALLIATPCFASPFITCEPYSAGAAQPDSFTVVLNGTTYTAIPETVTGGVRLKFDLAGKWIAGTNNATIKAANMWGESATVPFSFIAGAPAPPSGVGLIK
jgi:hypothetical protein